MVGTRAQLVKMAPVVSYANKMGLEFRVWFSGQHSESMADLLDDLGVPVDERFFGALGERDSVRSLAAWLPGALRRCVAFLKDAERAGSAKPIVVVHGDTLSALLGAVAARLVRAPVAHIESGLSSGSWFAPFPEEAVRRMIFRLTNIAYCPNSEAEELMCRFRQVETVGTGANTIVDSLKLASGSPQSANLGEFERLAIFSIHRFENIYHRGRLAEIVKWIIEAASCHDILFVLHPATLKRLESDGWFNVLNSTPRVTMSPRMSYSAFVSLLKEASVVVSDGGSNQEELAIMGVPTVLMRSRSERPDGLGANAVLEKHLGCPVGQYLVEERYQSLRQANDLDARHSPSKLIVTHLMQYVGR